MTVLTILAGGAGVVALMAAGTFLLPRHIHVERKAMIDRPPEAVLDLAGSTDGYQKFNPYLTADPALKITPFGPAEGVGAGFTFDGKDGKGTQTIASIDPQMVRYDIDLGAMGKPVQQISATKTANSTEVVWSMDMDLGFNPIARVMGLFMDRMVGKSFEQGLDNLAAAL